MAQRQIKILPSTIVDINNPMSPIIQYEKITTLTPGDKIIFAVVENNKYIPLQSVVESDGENVKFNKMPEYTFTNLNEIIFPKDCTLKPDIVTDAPGVFMTFDHKSSWGFNPTAEAMVSCITDEEGSYVPFEWTLVTEEYNEASKAYKVKLIDVNPLTRRQSLALFYNFDGDIIICDKNGYDGTMPAIPVVMLRLKEKTRSLQDYSIFVRNEDGSVEFNMFVPAGFGAIFSADEFVHKVFGYKDTDNTDFFFWDKTTEQYINPDEDSPGWGHSESFYAEHLYEVVYKLR